MNLWRPSFKTSDTGSVCRHAGGDWKHRTILPLLFGSLLVLPGCAEAPPASSSEETPAASASQALTGGPLSLDNEAKKAKILGILENFIPFAESFFKASDLSEPRTGRYDAVGSGVTQPRGAGDIAFAYVTLLSAKPDQTSFGGIDRAILVDHTIQSIRHEAFTNALSGKAYKKWGGGTWQASLETFSWAFAAHKLWDQLDDETRAVVKQVVTAEANILITKAMASGEEGDTGAEDNAWNSPTPALAAVMFPEEANAVAWHEAALRLAYNASSVAADSTDTTVSDGKPLNEWLKTVNLHPDLTLENHGYFNPIYQQVTHVDINDSAITYADAGRPIPEAFSFRLGAIWDAVLSRLVADEGDFVMPAGQDWTSKDFQHLDYLGIVATRLGRADASVFESRALELVAKRQGTHALGSMLGYTQVGYETMLIKRLAALYMTHDLFAPSPVPTDTEFESARKLSAGVKSFPYSDFIVGHLDKAFVSMSWDQAKPMALVIPHSARYADDPFFTYYAPQSLLGPVSGAIGAHQCDCQADHFSTAGSVGNRRFSMTAFADGTTFLLDRGQGSTFTYALEDIAGMTGARTLFSTANEGLGTLSGNWVNIADRLGMIVRGGGAISATKVTGTNNQLVITGSVGTGTGNRAAILLPHASHEVTAAVEPYATQLVTPEDWAAGAGRSEDGSLRVAVARWAGPPMTTLSLTDERGAPVPEEEADTTGFTAKFTKRLGSPASDGETIRFFVNSDAALKVKQESEFAAVLGNPTEANAMVAVTYVSPAGIRESRSRLLPSGDETTARIVGGALTLAGPELEPLVKAKDALAQLKTELGATLDDPRGCHEHHGWRRHQDDKNIQNALDAALLAVERATTESQSETVDARALAFAIERALRAVDRVEHALRELHLSHDDAAALRETLEAIEGNIREAAKASQSVDVWATSRGLAQPGETLTVDVNVRNHGKRPLRDGTLTLRGPEGWTAVENVAAFDRLLPGQSVIVHATLQVPLTAVLGETVTLVAEVDYDKGRHEGLSLAELQATIDPIVNLTPMTQKLPLGLRGANIEQVRLTNFADHAVDVTLVATAPDGVSIDDASRTLSIPALSDVDVPLTLRDVWLASGTGQVNLTLRTSAGAEVSSSFALSYSDDFALNTVGAPFPLSSATSYQAAYPPALAFDGNASTFWVSGGTVSGEGPTPASPKMLMVDLGTTQTIGSVTMVPRVGYGPKAYTIETSSDASNWQVVASLPSATNATIVTTFAPVQARYLRLQMTAGWDRIQPPRNVQIITLSVKAPPL